MHKSFSFKGIGGSCDKLLASEGECLELVNLRMVNGSLRPVPQTVDLAVLDNLYSQIYWHGQTSCYLCITDDSTSTIKFYDSEWTPLLTSSGKVLTFSSLRGVRGIEFVGTLVCCMTDSGLRYLISDNGTYKWLGERPVPPRLDITITSCLQSMFTEAKFRNDPVLGEESNAWRLHEKGYIDECIFNLESKGCFIDRTLFKFAIRLFDGSYIYCSQPFYVSDDNVLDAVGRDNRNMIAEPVDNTEIQSIYKVCVKGFKPAFRFSGLNFSNWKGVVAGIDIFVSGSIKGKKIETVNTTFYNTTDKQSSNVKYEKYVAKDIKEIWNDVNDVSSFYKFAEYDLNGNCLNTLEDVSMTNLLLQQSLASSEVASNLSSIVPSCSYVFNNRLHLGGIKEFFFKGYDKYSFIPVNGGRNVIEDFVVEVKIKTLNGTSRVVYDYGSIELGYKDGMFEIGPLLTYPDSRAYEMTLFAVLDTETFKKVLPLTPHKYLNISQYLHKWCLNYSVTVEAIFANGGSAAYISTETVLELFSEQVGVHKVVYSASKNSWLYNNAPFPPKGYEDQRIFAFRRDIADGDTLKFTIVYTSVEGVFTDVRNIRVDDTWQSVVGQNPYYEEYPYEERFNVMKVSLVDNPFIFPAKSAITPSKEKILSISNNAFELSQGKFGEHPLFVLCEDGIWAMSVDGSGIVAYSASYPISKEICRNPYSVCSVDAGIVFVSDKGVMLLSGNRIKNISEQMLPESESYNTKRHIFPYSDILSRADLSDISDALPFMDFVRGCKSAYISSTNEIIFSNSIKNYSYLYSLTTGMWSKIYEKAYGFVCDSKSLKMFMHYGYETVIKDFGLFINGANRIVLFTRPLLWGTKLSKRITELLLHAYIELNPDSDAFSPLFGCYLLCSNDGVNFKLLKGTEVKKAIQDIAFRYFPTSSYRYYIIALAGDVGKNTMITGVELDISLAWSNRLDN